MTAGARPAGGRAARGPIAVSLTPLALEADSRAFKVALSLRRFGYRSIVLEGARSSTDFAQHGLDVRALGPAPSAQLRAGGGVRRLRGGAAGVLGHVALFGAFWARFAWRHLMVPLTRLPRADLYYVHSYEYLPVALGLRRGARVVYDAHDFYQGILPREQQPEFDRKFLMPSLGRLEKAMARRCDAVVTVSHGCAKAIAETMGVEPHLVTNAVDRRANGAAADDIRTRLGLGNGQLLLVMVGNCKAGIPFDFVTAMVRELPPNVHLAFLGRGYEAAEADARRAGVQDRLHFVPALSPFEVTSFISAADCGLLLYLPISRNYLSGLPNGFFHLLDAGLPIVRFTLPEVEAVIDGAPVGPVLDAGDPGHSAQLLGGFLRDATQVKASRAAATALGDVVNWAAQEEALRRIVGASGSVSRALNRVD